MKTNICVECCLITPVLGYGKNPPDPAIPPFPIAIGIILDKRKINAPPPGSYLRPGIIQQPGICRKQVLETLYPKLSI
jgi:hypothetical protein